MPTISIKDLINGANQQRDALGTQLKGIGLTYDPSTNTFIHDPSYIQPQTAQTAQNIGLEQAATVGAQNALAPATAQAQYNAQAGVPITDPSKITNVVDASGKPAPLGVTGAQLNSGGYHQLTAAERDSEVPLTQATTILGQLQDASKAINTRGGNSYDALQVLEGLGKTAAGDPNAKLLSNNEGVLGPIIKGLLAVNRYNGGEVKNAADVLPKPWDSSGQAKAKLDRFNTLVASTYKSLGISSPDYVPQFSSESAANKAGTYLQPGQKVMINGKQAVWQAPDGK